MLVTTDATDTTTEIVKLVTAIVGAVGPEVVKAILDHGAANAAIPADARAQVIAILYPGGGSLLASEVEHAADVAAAAKVSP